MNASVIDKQVNSSEDDGYWLYSRYLKIEEIYPSLNYVWLGQNNREPSPKAYFRFTGITIPRNSLIQNAYITFTDCGKGRDGTVRIYGDDEDNPPKISRRQKSIRMGI